MAYEYELSVVDISTLNTFIVMFPVHINVTLLYIVYLEVSFKLMANLLGHCFGKPQVCRTHSAARHNRMHRGVDVFEVRPVIEGVDQTKATGRGTVMLQNYRDELS